MWIDAFTSKKKENSREMKIFYEDIYESNKKQNQKNEISLNNDTSKSNFKLETTTVWSFPNRGGWASHKGDYRGNFAPQIPRNVILRYTDQREVILDPMVGSGTTIIEAKILNRNSIGVDVNEKPLRIAKERIQNVESKFKTSHSFFVGDARNLDKINNNSVDLICTHPPYLNIIKYSDNNSYDLSLIGSVKEYIKEMKSVAEECFRVLKPNRYLAILIGDTRKNRHYVPLSAYLLKTFLDVGFLLKEDIIKHQWNCTSTPKWRKRSVEYNFHMIMHEHLYIFRKPEENEDLNKFKYSSNKSEIFD